MKVLQLISSGGYYGAESMLLSLVGNSQPRVLENLLVVFHNCHLPNIDLYNRAVAKGVPARVLRCQGRIDWKVLRRLRLLIRAHDIEIIHVHGYKAGLYGYLAARGEGKALVATCHNWPVGGMKLAMYHFLDRLVLKHVDAIGAVSEVIAEKLASFGVPRERVRVIPNGIDVRAFGAVPPAGAAMAGTRSRQVLGVVGRLDLQKGFEYLLKAIAGLHHSFPELRLLVIGEGPDRSRIENLISQLRLGAVVTLLGQRADMPTAYNLIDIFVLPSLNEGLPMALLEAMAASKAIVATRVGAVPKVIADEVTGLLVEPADEPALTHAISRLLSDPSLCRQLAQRARAHVERHYTAEAMTGSYREMYTAVLARRGGRKPSQAASVDGRACQMGALSAESSRRSERPTHTLAP
jgi:glycosyltransferase involved in cell wall biosynthesis